MSGGYELHPAAYDDLDGIWEFIAERNLDAADRAIADIRAAIGNLVPFPHMGHQRDDLAGRPLLFWPVRDYLIAYAPDKHPLWVLAVLHGRRNPRVMAAILRDRE
jgi:plasmid stabilization system protein ParE